MRIAPFFNGLEQLRRVKGSVQDLPKIEIRKWLVLFASVLLIYVYRNRGDVLKHHVV